MKWYGILFTLIVLIVLCKPCEGLFHRLSLQDYVDSFIDAAKFQIEGILSLNDSSINKIWTFFKSKYGRGYSSFG